MTAKPHPNTCPTCAKQRWYRRASEARAAASMECKACATRRSWAAPSEARLAATQVMVKAGASARRGRALSADHRAKLSVIHKGALPHNLGKQASTGTRAKLSAARRGRPRSEECRSNIRAAHHRRHGTAPRENKATVRELGAWAYRVIRRDGGRCACCDAPKTTPKSLNAHHILSRAKHPELALNLSNGVTLCVDCHSLEHRINGIL